MKRLPLFLLALAATVALAACGSETNASGTNPTNDTADSAVLDTGDDMVEDVTADTLPQDTTATDTAEDVTQTQPGEFGFTIRIPGMHSVECPAGGFGPPGPVEFPDADWLCTFAHGGKTGYVYVQSTPTGCIQTMGAVASFTSKGWFSDGTTVTALAAAEYDWGGNHHNDSLAFDWNNLKYKAYHSSFGWGWRACQDMDCLVVNQPSGDLIEDGCTTARTLPIVCEPILADGTHGPLVDQFAKCAGDPN